MFGHVRLRMRCKLGISSAVLFKAAAFSMKTYRRIFILPCWRHPGNTLPPCSPPLSWPAASRPFTRHLQSGLP